MEELMGAVFSGSRPAGGLEGRDKQAKDHDAQKPADGDDRRLDRLHGQDGKTGGNSAAET
jgi:hypothetical protein